MRGERQRSPVGGGGKCRLLPRSKGVGRGPREEAPQASRPPPSGPGPGCRKPSPAARAMAATRFLPRENSAGAGVSAGKIPGQAVPSPWAARPGAEAVPRGARARPPPLLQCLAAARWPHTQTPTGPRHPWAPQLHQDQQELQSPNPFFQHLPCSLVSESPLPSASPTQACSSPAPCFPRPVGAPPPTHLMSGARPPTWGEFLCLGEDMGTPT